MKTQYITKFWDATKVVHREKFIALNTYVKKEKGLKWLQVPS